MKSSFVLLSIALLLSSLSDAADFGSPSQPPSMSPTPGPSNSMDCSSVIYSMADCISFLMLGSADPSPTKTCCGGIKGVLEYNPKCLCSALESSREMGFALNDTKALAMPRLCNIPFDLHCVSSPTSSPSSTKSPVITPSSPVVRHSPPARPVSSSPVTASPPTATSSSPLPSKSSSGILSVSKLFLAAVMVSSFLYILA